MPIDHSKCMHPRTPAGRRACRVRHGDMMDLNDLTTTSMGIKVTVPHVSRETSEIPDDVKIPGLDITVGQARAMRGEEFLKKNFRPSPEL
jgi:hypothetical protein